MCELGRFLFLSVEDHKGEEEEGLGRIAEEGESSLEKEGFLVSRVAPESRGETEAGGGAGVLSAFRVDQKACVRAWDLGTSATPATDREVDVRKAEVEVWFWGETLVKAGEVQEQVECGPLWAHRAHPEEVQVE